MEITTGMVTSDCTSSCGKKYKTGDAVKIVGKSMNIFQQQFFTIHLSDGGFANVEAHCIYEGEQKWK